MSQDSGEIVVKVDAEIADLVPRFLVNRGRDVESLREAIARGDQDAVRKLGHSLKGVGGGYGFPEISEIGSRIEEAALQGSLESAAKDAEVLADYLKRVRVETA